MEVSFKHSYGFVWNLSVGNGRKFMEVQLKFSIGNLWMEGINSQMLEQIKQNA